MTDIHDTEDGYYWRHLSGEDLLAAVAAQIEPESDGQPVDGDYVRAVILDAVHTVTEDTMDRAVDMAHCNKVDECRAKAVFLAWLAWNIDHEMLPEALR